MNYKIYTIIVMVLSFSIYSKQCSTYNQFSHQQQFHYAIDAYDLKTMHHLINKIDINYQDKQGLTPLHKAIPDGKLEIIQFLVEHGANVNKVDHNGHTPLYKVSQYLIEAIAMCYADGIAPEAGQLFFEEYIKIAAYLVQAGTDLELQYTMTDDDIFAITQEPMSLKEIITAIHHYLENYTASSAQEMQAVKTIIEYLKKLQKVL